MRKPNYRKLFESAQARANRNAMIYHQLCRQVEHASKIASELHHAMERDSMGVCLPPYMKLAILANQQAASQAYMQAIREVVQ